jgi:excisionase family DNA binding protein
LRDLSPQAKPTTVTDTILVEFPPELLDQLADLLLPRLIERIAQREPDSRPRYLNVKQAADYLSMTEGALRHAIARGQIRGVLQEDVGHRIRIDRLELDRYLAERSRT